MGLGLGVGVIVGELDVSSVIFKTGKLCKKGVVWVWEWVWVWAIVPYGTILSKKTYLWCHDYHSTKSQPWCPSLSPPPLAPP